MTRETEWDDTERGKMEALALYESGVCDCGLHKSIARDDPAYTMEDDFCPVCAGIAQYSRIQADADSKEMRQHGEDPAPDIPRPDDGRITGLRLLTDAEAEEWTRD